MVASRNVSRATSVVSNSNARALIKRRKKPYRTEQQKIIAKKAKLDIHTSYHTQSPPGYTFLPVGTPDLAELCKELSRKRSLPINVVNAAPKSQQARDPSKVSHHIDRIGYHFRCEIVEEACDALGYVPYENTFITTADLVQKQQDSVIARAFEKHGATFDRVKANEETPEQVRAAIKELFPKIPQHDLDEVIAHAWDTTSDRVGKAQDLELPRRVQLAVIARARHTYTDYDVLLKAFGVWSVVRKMVEPTLLQKLIEWRGETGDDDEALEEIVRETIVIDDDDDDSSSDTSNASDISMEISHRPAAAEDLRAEEASERDHRFFHGRMPDRMQAQRTNLARQKIHTYRSQAHNARAFAQNQPAAYPYPTDRPFQRITLPLDDVAEAPGQVVIGGQVMRLVRGDAPLPYANLQGSYLQHDRPMQSIERDDHTYPPPPPPPPGSPPPPPPPPPPPAAYHSQPTTPQATRLIEGSHHHVDSPGYAQPAHDFPQRQYVRRQPLPQAQHSGGVIQVRSSGDGRYVQPPAYHHSYARAPEGAPRAPHALLAQTAYSNGSYHDANGVEYDPNRPLIDIRERAGHNTAPSSRYASPAQPAWRQHEHIPSGYAHHPAQPTVQYPYPRTVPQPVHGAPAPVQQAQYYQR